MASIFTEDMFYQGPRPVYGLGYRSGGLLQFYSHSLYWLVHYAGSVQVVAEILQDGEPVIYGLLNYDELDRLVAEGRIRQLRRHAWGVSWPFKEQAHGTDDDFSNYLVWRDRLLAEARLFCGDGQETADDTPPWLLS